MTTQEFEFIQSKIKQLAQLNQQLDHIRNFRHQYKNNGQFELLLRSGTGSNLILKYFPDENVDETVAHYIGLLEESVNQLEAEMSAITLCKKLTDDTTDNPGPDPE